MPAGDLPMKKLSAKRKLSTGNVPVDSFFASRRGCALLHRAERPGDQRVRLPARHGRAEQPGQLVGGAEHLFRFVLRCREHLDIAPFGK